jgi:hypothetical protein
LSRQIPFHRRSSRPTVAVDASTTVAGDTSTRGDLERKVLAMARVPASVALVIGCLALSATAGAQVLTFARDDYGSDAGARAIASADFNRDGWLDVAQASLTTNSVTILLNRGGSSLVRAFETPVGLGPFDLTTGDFNRDGIPDLAVANADSHAISILLGRGDGSFKRADIAAPLQNPRGITTADVNNDGRPDLIYTGYATGTVQVLLGNGAGGFTKGATVTVAGSQPQGVAAGDFDHDGHLDLAVACNSGLRILYGSSRGTFTVRTIAGHANLNVVAVGDLNGDGWADVAAASTGGSDVAIYAGGASGLTFTHTYVVGASPRGIAVGDVNGDGRLDVITANRASSTVSVLAADGAHPGAFLTHQEFAAARGSRAVALGDFNGDGRPDVATANEYSASITVLSNVTALKKAAFTFGALTLPSNAPLAALDGRGDSRFSTVPRIAVADFNRDGKMDFVVPGGSISAPDAVVVMLRDGPAVTLRGPLPLTRFVVADFNGDGNPDILYYSTDPAATNETTRFLTYLGDGRGHFTASPITTEPQSLGWCVPGDLNRDGRQDLVCDNLILLGNGNGTFPGGVPYVPAGANAAFPGPLVADVNRDGKLDIVSGEGVSLGDGTGGFTPGESFADLGFFEGVLAVADLNHDGFIDLVVRDFPDSILVVFGGAAGFQPAVRYTVIEDYAGVAVADMNGDGHPDIVVNGTLDPESAGLVMILFGNAEGTFTPDTFLLRPGPIALADVTGDGLPDVAAYDAHAVHVLVNERNDISHPPVVPNYSVTSGYPCATLDARVSEPDQHVVFVRWFDASGAEIASGSGDVTRLNVCVDKPGTYRYRRTADDLRGGTASGTVTFTYVVTLQEIVLYAAADNVTMAGNWSRVADATAAGSVRAHDANLGAAKVTQPSATPTNSITIPFLADPNLSYKLWVRLKADANSWANDSVWVQFSGAASAPYTAGTTTGLSVNLEECVNCGESGWGWEDDGYGAVNKNGALLRFDAGPQVIVIQTREDGVSIDQVVLSAAKYLTTRPGTAKNDHTILPATPKQ